MNKLLCPALAVGLFLTLGALPLAAQATELKYDHRVAGDRALTIQLGLVVPEASQNASGSFGSPNLSLGGTLGIDLDFYLNDSFRLGGGLRGKATSSPNKFTLFMVPITFRGSYEFKFDHFSFPVGLGAGFSFTNFKTATSFDPILMPFAGAYYNLSSSWSFGLNASQWVVFQPYFAGGSVPTSDSRIAYFADLTLGAIYHF